MKILKYMRRPMKYLLLLLAFGALIYFRAIIFHTNVNQYIDKAVAYVEQELEYEIPSYEPTVVNEVVVKSEPAAVTIDQAVIEPVVNDAPADSPVANTQAASVVEPAGSQSDEVPVTTPATSLIKEESWNESKKLIEQLADAVGIINEKVDRLFDVNNQQDSDLQKNDQAVIEQPITQVKAEEGDKSGQQTMLQDATVNTGAAGDVGKVLLMARQSYWGGDKQLSEKYYLELSQNENANADIFGELGNVYYSQGKWKQAGQAYYEAAVRLLALNRQNQVDYLLRVIQGLDQESADKLRQKISG